MNENDFLIDDEDQELDPFSGFDDPIPQEEDETEENESTGSSEEDEGSESDQDSSIPANMTSYEIELAKSYDALVKAGDLTDAVQIVISANPVNNNGVIVGEKLKEFMQLQGKTRIVNNYSAGLLVAADVESDLEGDDSSEVNEAKQREIKDLIWRFIKYLAERDLSQDSPVNRRRKLRHIPALIIYLFSNKMYGILINCPYLPEDYQDQVRNALNKINERKYELVDELASMLESTGSTELGAKVRDMKLSFFDIEPAELRKTTELRNITISDNDVIIYKSIRNKYVNITKSITQEVASDLIEVIVDKDAGMYERLKDKVRAEAINEVKALLKEFAESSITEKDNEVAISILLNK